ncbi:MAG TPA: YCF48-related protein [Bacteroidales bacterium]|nr:YCF48-related protein [Bacteroidales bacterium]
MNKSFLILITASFLTSVLNAQWNWFNPKPMGGEIYDIQFVNDSEAYACGSLGHIIKTVDGGNNWFSYGCICSEHLVSLSFINENTGWVFGTNSTILKTTDGASSWTSVNTDLIEENFTSGKLFNETIAMVGCQSGKIYRTNDGGSSWNLVSTNNNCIYKIFFYNSNIGFAACSNGIILKTSDGGNSWSSYETNNPDFFTSIFFPSEDIGYACGFLCLFKTTDGGDSWSEIQVSEEEMYDYNFFDCYFTDDNTGYLVTGQGYVFSTTNGGISWEMSVTEVDQRISTIEVSESNDIFVGNELGKIFKSVDNSQSWTCQTTSYTKQYINSIAFINPDQGIAVGNKGVVLRTFNGGCAWELLNWGTDRNLTEVIYLSEEKIIVSSSLGTVYISENSGNSWTPYTVKSGFYIKRMFFIDENNGWAVGSSGTGTVCKTSDGGHSWTQQSIDNHPYLYDVVFTSLQTGFIATVCGKIFVTSDGGTTWSPVLVGTVDDDWYSVDYINSDTIFACGSNCKIAKTYDGGITWTDVSVSTSGSWFEDINMFEDGTGYCVGLGGIAYQTRDFGDNWEIIPRFADTHFMKIIRNDNMQLFVTGYNGAILSNRLDPRNMINKIEPENQIVIGNIYPIPASQIIYFNIGSTDYSIFDIRGKNIKSGNSNYVNISNIENGLYFIRYINSNMKVITEKIIISH